MTNAGITIKLPVDQISILGRVTQGLRLISLRDNQLVATISVVDKNEEDDEVESNKSNESFETIQNTNDNNLNDLDAN